MVTISTLVWGRAALRRLSTARPSSAASWTSSMTTSGRNSAARWSASSAVAASPTTAISGTLSMLRRPSRTIGWSSTIRTRIGRLGAIGGPRTERQARADSGAVLGPPLDDALAAQQPGALPHREQAEPAARRLARGALEAHAPVGDREEERRAFLPDVNVDPRRARVLEGVGERFLDDAECGGLDGGGQAGVLEVLGERDGPARLSGDLVEARPDGRHEPDRVHQRRPERGQESPHLDDRPAHPVERELDLALGARRVALPEIAAGVQVLLGAH